MGDAKCVVKRVTPGMYISPGRACRLYKKAPARKPSTSAQRMPSEITHHRPSNMSSTCGVKYKPSAPPITH